MLGQQQPAMIRRRHPSHTSQSALTRTLPGLMSRWRTWAEWMNCRAKANQLRSKEVIDRGGGSAYFHAPEELVHEVLDVRVGQQLAGPDDLVQVGLHRLHEHVDLVVARVDDVEVDQAGDLGRRGGAGVSVADERAGSWRKDVRSRGWQSA